MGHKVTKTECLTPGISHLRLWQAQHSQDGEESPWVFASRKESPECEQPSDKPDAVVVIPFWRDEIDEASIVVVKQFRPPIGDYEYDFVAGLVDPGETVAEAAARELFEETGFVGEDMRIISPKVFSSPGMTDESVVFVFTEVSGIPSCEHQDKGEDIEVVIWNSEKMDLIAERKPGYDNLKMTQRLWAIIWTISLTGTAYLKRENKLKTKLRELFGIQEDVVALKDDIV
jgi:ADP-ribose pyrophosphatase